MKDVVKGEIALTIDMKAGDIYPIEYDNIATATIANYTDDGIYVSEKPEFEFNEANGAVGKFLVISSGAAYNDYIFYKSGKNTLYIKALTDGYVTIVRKRW